MSAEPPEDGTVVRPSGVAPRAEMLAPVCGSLRLYGGPMGAGKSGLALQLSFNRRSTGRAGVLLTSRDRAGVGVLSSRLGISAVATEISPATDLATLVAAEVPAGGFVIVDEAQFLTADQVEQLAWAADELGVDVDCFGILTDFQSRLFPGAARLIELADAVIPLQVEVVCWCGRPGRQNARIINGQVARDGARVAVGDTAHAASVTYRVMCRRHWRNGDLGPSA
jgi:thymidine kinase